MAHGVEYVPKMLNFFKKMVILSSSALGLKFKEDLTRKDYQESYSFENQGKEWEKSQR